MHTSVLTGLSFTLLSSIEHPAQEPVYEPENEHGTLVHLHSLAYSYHTRSRLAEGGEPKRMLSGGLPTNGVHSQEGLSTEEFIHKPSGMPGPFAFGSCCICSEHCILMKGHEAHSGGVREDI